MLSRMEGGKDLDCRLFADQFLECIPSFEEVHCGANHGWSEKGALSSKFLGFFELFPEPDEFLDASCFWTDAIGPEQEAETVRAPADCATESVGCPPYQDVSDSDDAGFVGFGREQPIFEIFSAPSAEEVASLLGPCPSPSGEWSEKLEFFTPSETLAGADDESFLECCLVENQDSCGELFADCRQELLDEVASPCRGTDEPPSRTYRKRRSVKNMARNGSWKGIIPTFRDDEEEARPVESEVVDVTSVLPIKSGSSFFSDQELVQILVAIGQLKGELQVQALLKKMDYMIQRDLYDCTESCLADMAQSKRSPLYFIAKTKYSDFGEKSQVTRLRSPPVRRGWRKHGCQPCRRWMQRGKSKVFKNGNANYGKTYFSYGLRDPEGRRKRKAQRGHTRLHITESESCDSESESQVSEENGEKGACRSARRNRRAPNAIESNAFQMYELHLKEDMDEDWESRRQRKGPKPYWVICVLKYDNAQWAQSRD